MTTIHLATDFREFLQLLNDRGVEYLLIGSYALACHGYIRATNDIDFWVATNAENADKVVSTLKEFGFSEVSSDMFSQPGQIVRMGVPPLRIELTTSIDGVEFETCFAERVIETIDGVDINIISLKHLRRNKLASGRLKDLSDLEHLPEAE